MRIAFALLVACSSPAKRTEPITVAPVDVAIAPNPIRLAILDLNSLPVGKARARVMTTALREAALAHPAVVMNLEARIPPAPACRDNVPKCMATFAQSLSVDRLIYGQVNGTDAEIVIVFADTAVELRWITVALPADDPGMRASAKQAITRLLAREPEP